MKTYMIAMWVECIKFESNLEAQFATSENLPLVATVNFTRKPTLVIKRTDRHFFAILKCCTFYEINTLNTNETNS